MRFYKQTYYGPHRTTRSSNNCPTNGSATTSGLFRWIVAFVIFGLQSPIGAQQESANAQSDRALEFFRSMDGKVATLKEKALELNRDLILIEEESFIPGSAHLVVFFGLEKKTTPQNRHIQVRLELDGIPIANHTYEKRELSALHRSGKHRLYLGSVPVGKHHLVAKFSGSGGSKDFETRTSIEFTKAWERKNIEVMMSLPEKDETPKVSVHERNS